MASRHESSRHESSWHGAPQMNGETLSTNSRPRFGLEAAGRGRESDPGPSRRIRIGSRVGRFLGGLAMLGLFVGSMVVTAWSASWLLRSASRLPISYYEAATAAIVLLLAARALASGRTRA